MCGIAGIINYKQVVEKFSEEFRKNNSKNKVLKSIKVTGVENKEGFKLIQTNKGTFKTNYAIFAAGLYADEMAKLDKIKLDLQIDDSKIFINF